MPQGDAGREGRAGRLRAKPVQKGRQPRGCRPVACAARGGQSGRSSLKVRVPEIIVETMDWRDMMSSRIAT